MKKLILLGVVTCLLMSCNCGSRTCETKKCKDFKTRKEAQEFYDNNKKCNTKMDGDKDGKVCESLPE